MCSATFYDVTDSSLIPADAFVPCPPDLQFAKGCSVDASIPCATDADCDAGSCIPVRNVLNPDDLQPYAGVPYFWSDQYGHRLQLVGIATAEEPAYVHDPPGEPTLLALYREGDRLAGAFAIDRVQWLMRMRTLLTQRAGFDEAVALAEDLAASQ